jgi:hypothetical protein
MNTRLCIALLASSLAPALATGQTSASAREALLACAGIREGVARLDCYDRAAETARGQGVALAPPVAGPTPPPAVTAAPPVARTEPSIGEEQVRRRNEPAEPAEALALHARIADARRGGGGIYLLTLDNGNVWRHEEGSMAEYLKIGEAVTIRPGTLGSYRLTLDSGSAKNWVRVTRVR